MTHELHEETPAANDADGGALFTRRADFRDAAARATKAARAYYTGDTLLMDDGTYDRLLRALSNTRAARPDWDDANLVLDRVAAGTSGDGDVVHSEAMLSLNNVFSIDELKTWMNSLAKRIDAPVQAWAVEPKLDGLALSALYRNGRLERLATRGSGDAGEDVTYAADSIVGLPAALPHGWTFEVRGEVMLTTAQYEQANEMRLARGETPFKNPRNGAAGTLRGAASRDYVIPMTFFAYAVIDTDGDFHADQLTHTAAMAKLHDAGINTAAHAMTPIATSRCTTHAALETVEALSAHRFDLPFGIDGAVVKADEPAQRNAAGSGSRAPHWAIAYKYPTADVVSTLEEVIWQVGRTGVITPRARIAPAELLGTTITYATLHNPADLERKGFQLHDKVLVTRAGEVIPRLEAPLPELRDGTQTPIVAPDVCPQCGGDIDRTQARWRCTKGRACGLAPSIIYAASTAGWDIDGLGRAVVEQLVKAGHVTSVASIFTLDLPTLAGLDRMGETSAANLLEQIDRARTAPLARTVTALGIRGTGRSLSRRIADHFTSLHALQNATTADLMEVRGIGEEKAALIRAELDELTETIAALADAGVALADAESIPAGDGGGPHEGAPQALAGLAVVVTGAMTGPLASYSRTAVSELLEAAGAKVQSSVSSRTSVLVAGEKAGSKLAKAQSLGVEVWTPETLAERLGVTA